MQFLVDIIPAKYRRLAYGIAAAAAAAVAVLGKAGVIPTDGAEQIAAVLAVIVTATAHANTNA